MTTATLIVQGGKAPAPDALTHIAALSHASSVRPISATSFHLPRADKTPESVAAIAQYAQEAHLDVFWRDDTKLRMQNFRAFISDMDSTLITIECIDELWKFYDFNIIDCSHVPDSLDVSQSPAVYLFLHLINHL